MTKIVAGPDQQAVGNAMQRLWELVMESDGPDDSDAVEAITLSMDMLGMVSVKFSATTYHLENGDPDTPALCVADVRNLVPLLDAICSGLWRGTAVMYPQVVFGNASEDTDAMLRMSKSLLNLRHLVETFSATSVSERNLMATAMTLGELKAATVRLRDIQFSLVTGMGLADSEPGSP